MWTSLNASPAESQQKVARWEIHSWSQIYGTSATWRSHPVNADPEHNGLVKKCIHIPRKVRWRKLFHRLAQTKEAAAAHMMQSRRMKRFTQIQRYDNDLVQDFRNDNHTHSFEVLVSNALKTNVPLLSIKKCVPIIRTLQKQILRSKINYCPGKQLVQLTLSWRAVITNNNNSNSNSNSNSTSVFKRLTLEPDGWWKVSTATASNRCWSVIFHRHG